MTLSEARRRREWTQRQLALASGVPQQEISRIENGQVRKPSHESVMAIAEALGVPPSEIHEFKRRGRR